MKHAADGGVTTKLTMAFHALITRFEKNVHLSLPLVCEIPERLKDATIDTN